MLKVANSVINASQIATPITFAGDVTLSTGNLVIGTSGKGIDFTATTSGSGTMTSELLADYEEGVFDASFLAGGGSITINSSVNRCRYTKIGRQVTVNGFLAVSSVSTPSGPWVITGLPFTIGATTEGDTYAAASIHVDGLEATAVTAMQAIGVPNSANIYIYSYSAGVSTNAGSLAKAGSEIVFSLTYSV